MEVYSNDSERDQTEAVKRFFTSNGKALVTGAVIGIIALVGWRVWTNHQQKQALVASGEYQALIKQMSADKPDSLAKVSAFSADDHSTYGALAALSLAKVYTDKGDLQHAAGQLEQGLKDTSDDNLQSVLRLRLARIQSALKQPDDALKTLESVKGDSWKAMVADIRGEVLLSKGDKQGARAAWSQGITSDASPALKQMIQMKLNNLS